jgi:hypothetical protein
MGYSSRYHAASLAAIFLALAIGILIGTGLGDNVVSGTQEQLEKSLKGDLQDARAEADDLGELLNDEREFGQRVYPVLVGGRLRGERAAIISLGGLAGNVSDEIESALQPTGAKVVEVAVVREPPNLEALADRLRRGPFRRIEKDEDVIEAFGRRLGRQLVRGGALANRTRDQALSRASGQLGRVNNVVLVREAPEDAEPDDAAAIRRLEEGVLDGIRATGVPVVAVERSDSKTSSIGQFDSHGIPTVDSVDLTSGKVAMVFALLGAEGNFGVKGSADRLLPDLLVPARG